MVCLANQPVAKSSAGFFCGNVGVARTYLGELVDSSNEAQADMGYRLPWFNNISNSSNNGNNSNSNKKSKSKSKSKNKSNSKSKSKSKSNGSSNSISTSISIQQHPHF